VGNDRRRAGQRKRGGDARNAWLGVAHNRLRCAAG
jgi:hypothetical protein